MITFSVIIPSHNRIHLLPETIDSILQQTWLHYEIIVVDDGSTDNTGEVLKQRYSAEQRLKYFYKENEERGAARNFGLKCASGDYAVFFDSDDRMLPHYLETLALTIGEKPGINLLATKYNYIRNGKTEFHPQLQKLKEGWYDRSLFLRGNMLACNYCVRIKDHLFTYFPPQRELATMEDWLFLLANLESEKIFIKDRICITMLQHEERSMTNNRKVIAARNAAVTWALTHLKFSPADKRKLIAWSHYFYGVHQYLDYNRWLSFKEAFTAFIGAGPHRQILFLLVKSLIGRKLVQQVK